MPTSTPTIAETGALDLARAIVISSPVPLLLLDGDLCIVAASASFSDAFSVDTKSAPGQPLASLGGGRVGSAQGSQPAHSHPLRRGRHQGL